MSEHRCNNGYCDPVCDTEKYQCGDCGDPVIRTPNRGLIHHDGTEICHDRDMAAKRKPGKFAE